MDFGSVSQSGQVQRSSVIMGRSRAKTAAPKLQELAKATDQVSFQQLKQLGAQVSQINTPQTQATAKTEAVIPKKSPAVSQQKYPQAQGSMICKVHKFRGAEVGTEVVKRVPGAQKLYETLRAQETRLQQDLDMSTSIGTNRSTQRLGAKLRSVQEQLVNLDNDAVTSKSGEGFFGSTYVRTKIGDAIKEQGLPQEKGRAAGEAYEAIANTVSAGLIHARTERLTVDGKEEASLLRLGVMSDLRNGSVSVKSLRAMRDDDKLRANTRAAIQQRQSKTEPGSPEYASLQMAINQLESRDALEAALTDRELRMETQMLQYLTLQAERCSEKLEALAAGKEWHVVDVRLLSPKKDAIDHDFGSGWVHNEQHQIDDMQDIFETFNGRTLVFGEGGPHTDGHKIYIPVPLGNKSREIKLKSQLLNVSIQGQTENVGSQKALNGAQVRELVREYVLNRPEGTERNQDLIDARALLRKGESNGTVAESLVRGLVKAGVTVSTGCLSAKDRTGWVVGRTMVKSMVDAKAEQFKREGVEDQDYLDEMQSELTDEIVEPDGVAMRCIKQVTPEAEMLKLDPRTTGRWLSVRSKLKVAWLLTKQTVAKKFSKKRDSVELESSEDSPKLTRRNSRGRLSGDWKHLDLGSMRLPGSQRSSQLMLRTFSKELSRSPSRMDLRQRSTVQIGRRSRAMGS